MSWKDVDLPDSAVVLVTGGAGFIGSNLCEALIEKGCQVRCLDNLSTGSMNNIDRLLDNERFAFIKGDIVDYETCADAADGVDFVMHEAAWGSVPRSIEMPRYYEQVNIAGTLNMMEAARQADVKKFVYASSSSVYGDSQELPKREGQEGNVLSPYALTKLVDEGYGRLYHELYGLETYALRYFNVFGRRQSPDGAYAAVIPRFVNSLLRGEQPTINGDGLQSRDFTYVDNVIEANFRACLAPGSAAGQVYNIGFGCQVTLLELFDTIRDALGSDIQPIFGSPRTGDVRHSNADISKARALLGYDPEFSFEQGISCAIEWYKNYLS